MNYPSLGTTNSKFVCQREKRNLHDAFIFPSKHFYKIIFSKYESNGENVKTCNIPIGNNQQTNDN
jgi:hypothetical protein